MRQYQTLQETYSFSESYQEQLADTMRETFDIVSIKDKPIVSLFKLDYSLNTKNKKPSYNTLQVNNIAIIFDPEYNYKIEMNQKHRFPLRSTSYYSEDVSSDNKVKEFFKDYIDDTLTALFAKRKSEIIDIFCSFIESENTVVIEVVEMKTGEFKKYRNSGFFHQLVSDSIVYASKPLIHEGMEHYISTNNIVRNVAEKYISNTFLSILEVFDLAIYQKLNEIATSYYEGAECCGKILFCKENDIVNSAVMFVDRMPLTNYKGVRKLLEIAQENIYLLSNGKEIIGFIEWTNELNNRINGYSVTFVSHANWDLEETGNRKKKIFHVSYGIPQFPKAPLEEAEFAACFNQAFSNRYHYRAIWDLCTQAKNQQKGTMLVISEQATAEASRLSNQCIRLEYKADNKNFFSSIKHISAIDGAVLLHPDGNCHAIGVILDGTADTRFGDRSRGARYNSAYRYLHSTKYKNCLILVVSEDGMIDLIHTNKL